MSKSIFSPDCPVTREATVLPGAPISQCAAYLRADVSQDVKDKGSAFAREITARFYADFHKSDAMLAAGRVTETDLMAHVSTFLVRDGYVYVSYYANTKNPAENPLDQVARLAYCPIDHPEETVILDIQAAGDPCGDKSVNMVYDTILMPKDDDTLFLLWTARVEENYYRFYRTFSLSKKELGEVQVNRFRVGDTVNDFSASGIRAALTQNGIGYKRMFSDIGIMQKLSCRIENGVPYYYTGAYSGDFTCIIKSRDLITWEYVSQPDFINDSKWENATYVLGDRCYYFVRQNDGNPYGFLTAYDLNTKKWDTPIQIEDCQSRGDFIVYRDQLYLVHAPIDRTHIGIVKICCEDLSKSEILLQAKMDTGCFYPFVQYFRNGELAMSYTVDRKAIRLAEFDLSKYL